MANPKSFVGLDGGGSKTAAIVVDEQGQELGRAVAGGSNYQGVGLDVALANVQTALRGAMTAAGFAEGVRPTIAIVGLAGIDRPADKERWQAALSGQPPLADKLELTGDSDLILYALPDGQGLGLIAGTGSIALGRDRRGKRIRSGGWGHFMGDEGSGLWLGREALNAATRAADGRGPKTELLPLILKEWDLQEPSDLIGAVYGSREDKNGVDNARVASLSRVVIAASEQGDEHAQMLMKNAINELALALKACDRQLFFETPPGLAIAGGLLLHHPALIALLTHRLEAMMTIGPVVEVEEPALYAARAAISLQG